MIRKHFATLALAAVVIIPTPVLLSVTHTAATADPGRTCFSAASWDADDAARPCVRIVRVEEDGSFRFRAEDADGTLRYVSGVGALDR